MAGPIFDQSAAYEMLTFMGPDVLEGAAALTEKRAPRFPSAHRPWSHTRNPPERLRDDLEAITLAGRDNGQMRVDCSERENRWPGR
jgi:hypothetical protein